MNELERALYQRMLDERKNALAQEMSHTYSGDANALGPLASGVQGMRNALAERLSPEFYGKRFNDLVGTMRDLPNALTDWGDGMEDAKLKLKEAGNKGFWESTRGLMNAINDPKNEEVMALLNAFGPQNLGGFAGITAYHGSPHKFDKFRMSKIGTGEGAQAYGHGLYFAENPKTAEVYRDQLRPLTDVKSLRLGGIPIKQAGKYVDYSPTQYTQKPTVQDFVRAKLQEDALINEHNFRNAFDKEGVDGVKKLMLSNIDDQLAEARMNWKEAIPELERIKRNILTDVGNKIDFKTGTSNLYKVDIADDAVKNFLDWDKPLSQQPESVRKAIQNFAKNTEFDTYDNLALASVIGKHPRDKSYQAPMSEILNDISSVMGIHGKGPELTKFLQSRGIPGIRYLDQGSRQGGKGTSNFVVFDEDIVKILERK